MSLPSVPEKRGERPDTKTLVRLGVDLVEDTRASDPPPSVPPSAPISEPPPSVAPSTPPPDPELVELSFAGVPSPVRVRATREASGLSLRTALPFLEVGSVVGVSAPEDGAPQNARIGRVSLAPGAGSTVPELSVELTFSDAPVSVPLPDDALPTHVERRAPRLPALGLGLALGAVLGTAATLGVTSLRAHDARTAPAVARLAARVVPPIAAIVQAAPVQAATPIPTPTPTPIAFPDPTPFTEAAPEALGPSDPIDDDPAMQVEADANQTRVLIPMHGDASDLRTYDLSTPGLAVTLPHARASAPFGNQRIVTGLVRRVWLLPVGQEGVQVRVITRRPATHSDVTFDEAGLHITLAH